MGNEEGFKFPDMEAAFEAVKGMLFGPLDPGLVKHKFNEIARDDKERRDLEMSSRGPLGLALNERDTRERKDRDYQHLTLTALLASNAEYRRAHEAAMEAFAAAGNAIDDAIEAGEKGLADVTERIEDYLASTPRLKDGRYVMFDPKDGLYKDQDFKTISEVDLAGIDKEAVKEILPYERMMAWKEKVTAEVDRQKGRRSEVGEWQNEATDQKNPTQQETLEERTERSTDYEKDAREAQQFFGSGREYLDASMDSEAMTDKPSASASIVLPPMP